MDEHILLGYRDQRARTRLQSGYSNEVGAMIKLADTATFFKCVLFFKIKGWGWRRNKRKLGHSQSSQGFFHTSGKLGSSHSS